MEKIILIVYVVLSKTVSDLFYTQIPKAALNLSWRQYPTKQQLYGHFTGLFLL